MNGPILFLVPVRGGSPRVPGKNLRVVGGIPLVGRAVRVARQAAASLPGGPHRVACSTDDPAIAEVAAAWGAEVIDRPPALATDDATSIAVVLHALGDVAAGQARYTTLVLLQPTSPRRRGHQRAQRLGSQQRRRNDPSKPNKRCAIGCEWGWEE